MFAIVRTGGKQYRVRAGDVIAVERLDGEPGDEITLHEVLLVGPDADPTADSGDSADAGELVVGEPLVAGATVTARVQAQVRGPHLDMMRYKNKTRQRTHRGHRQRLTQLAITAIAHA